jgi:uncharacterized protein affecting Mg2+/Co2+ transport
MTLQSPSFEDLPRSIATSSILPYVASGNWLNFRAASRGCYEIVHGTADVWHSSDRASASDQSLGANAACSDSRSGNVVSESEALWRLALARDYHFEAGADDDECLRSIRSPAVAPNDDDDDDDDDAPFLSTGNIFTASNSFISWKHWRKIDLMCPSGGALSGPSFLRAGRMWRKIEEWCDDVSRSGQFGREIKSSLSPGRPFYPNTSLGGKLPRSANLSAFQAVYAFYAGQRPQSSILGGMFGGFHAYDVTSTTRWMKPQIRTSQSFIVIAQGSMKAIAMCVQTGQVYSISHRNQQLVATPCRGGIDHIVGRNHLQRPANPADGKDSLLRWFEEYAHRLHRNYYAVGILNPDDDGRTSSLMRYPTVNDAANCSRAVTRGVEVVASAILVEEMGMFVYSIRMRLLTPDDGEGYMPPEQRGFGSCQLVLRHWKISKFVEATGPPEIDEVRGGGVVGCFPILREGSHENYVGGGDGSLSYVGSARGAFSYQSCTHADCPGAIEGYFQFRPGSIAQPSGDIFDVRVDPFPLAFSHFLY